MTVHAAILQVLGSLTVAAPLLALACFLFLVPGRGRDRVRDWFGDAVRHPIVWALVVSTIATAGSLYFSEVVHMEPCELCWYQRIAMYPLVPILAVGAFRADPGVWRYALPLPLLGILISAYHVVIQFGPPGIPQPCGTGVPCSARYIAVFGFISIPVMAGAAFLLTIALLLVIRHLEGEGEEGDSTVTP